MKPDQSNIDRWLAARKKQREGRTESILLNGLINGERTALGQAITLIESSNLTDQKQAQQLLQALPVAQKLAKRIGITGVPGVGKSTFIENFGLLLVEAGYKVAVLAIDPSSSRTGGSILGDKTRMERLSQHPNVFIRPTAAGRTLGGVAKNTREAIALCEAAGYDIILIETVGVGQSETLVHGMVDCFLLLMLAGAGDELQGIKRGIMELADLIVINKADGTNEAAAKAARAEYAAAIHVFGQRPDYWTPRVLCASGLTGSGLQSLWEQIESFFVQLAANGHLSQKRQEQELQLFEHLLNDFLQQQFFANPLNQEKCRALRKEITKGQLLAYEAMAAFLGASSEIN
ncbi:MAG: methylmalonyl Co-A mutase-associated GTPase MeaB [Sphingomonadales bacterium]|nr:methylmalonyl Co-A mutase-associated GTPase MeaB [Sphingomonadales bacterium]